MKDCSKDVLAYHDDKVTLPQAERTNMRDRRDANRERLRKRLKERENPSPQEFVKQGSYAMLTMVQDAANDYDIDDGVYFTQASLKGSKGGDKPAMEARQMVCDALADSRFNKAPEVKRNCVRVFYNDGYHVDMPVYRIRTSDGDYELASGSDWKHSRAADVEEWFNQANQTKSPDENNGRQFRRIVRLLKKFAKSRNSWKSQTASGFSITILAEEQYVSNKDREDAALRDTMNKIYNRLLWNLEVSHPVTPGAKVTKGPDDTKMRVFRDKLKEALDNLAVLDDADCTREKALKAWDKVFNTDYFMSRYKGEEKVKDSENSAFLSSLIATKSEPVAVQKNGGGRFA
ncbi:hypothetical protein SAMN05660860_00144 [Geoalkalibacter ferrihydriticus]|uniref:Cyclic GMP-AMP synthase n=2 Tax=Geoalkalibacter ferrihydriticus TaxID=392333 RepID=A0A0C2ECC9_9BACT|nr:hypothetical protein [Geoalkalibacter ferrihydriticus]KIH76243.1 hypothetical protein GFER_11520 [Geoalkalibacter ferrihydriticus DSM 17813]SDL24833.1 hypothetical protein SAMN05660860_00144 [Geoalkalibacter ferrihydriticus]